MLFFYATSAYSWGEIGHQAVGEIAERFLNPETKNAINNILGPEKLAMAATWPDSIKDDPDFNGLKSYHFIDPKASKDLMTVLNQFPRLLLDPAEERSVKMIALRYIIHIVGDIHQPLHAGIKDDRGGNFCQVEWDNKILNLHSIWDGKIIEYDITNLKSAYSPLKFYGIMTYADDILKLHPLSETDKIDIQSKNFSVWIKESQDAELDVYPNEDAQSYCQQIPTSFPKITKEYKDKAVKITRTRILYGGLRLAAFLNKIFIKGATPGQNNSLSKEQVLKRLDLQN